MKIYISGKITGTSDYMERFAAVEQRLRLDGHKVVNPAKKNAHMPDGTTWVQYMRRCIKWLVDCDAIYLMRGWRKSPGARLEQMIAVALDMIILSQEKGE